MDLLLDTHILLWIVIDSPLLSAKARAIIGDMHNTCRFSPVSISEISLKHKKHPDRLSLDGGTARSEFLAIGICELPLTSTDAAEADSLELFHNDPFDHMLIAQAKAEGMMLMSHDPPVSTNSVNEAAFTNGTFTLNGATVWSDGPAGLSAGTLGADIFLGRAADSATSNSSRRHYGWWSHVSFDDADGNRGGLHRLQGGIGPPHDRRRPLRRALRGVRLTVAPV